MATTYDTLPYLSLPKPESHPEHLATIASLLGQSAPDLKHARILELGCAAGGNLLPIAATLPGSTCVGVDLSQRQIDDGKKVLQRAGLSNVSLHAADIATLRRAPLIAKDPYDFIICHGVYSWISEELQHALLEACSSLLSPHGLVYLSYNTLPGWASMKVLRDAMRFGAREATTPTAKISAGMQFLSTILEHGGSSDDAYYHLISRTFPELRKESTEYLFHEYFEDDNHACYFEEFCERALGHGLQYLGDAQFALMSSADMAPSLQRELPDRDSQRIRYEQTLDFLRNRRFRESILFKPFTSPILTISPDRLRTHFFSGRFSAVSTNPDIAGTREETFTSPRGGELRVANSIQKAALIILSETWPERISFEELLKTATLRLNAPSASESDRIHFGEFLLKLLEAHLLDTHLDKGLMTKTIADRPRVTSLARAQAVLGEHVTSLRHKDVVLEPIVRHVMTRLDGANTKESIVTELTTMVVQGTIVVEDNGQRLSDRETASALMSEVVSRTLARLSTLGFLLSPPTSNT